MTPQKRMSMPYPRINIEDLKPKDEISSIYLVKYISLQEAKDKKKYLNIVLCDATGELEGRAWANAEVIFDSIQAGNYIKVSGRVNVFQGRMQFIINDFEKINDKDIVPEEYQRKSAINPDKMFMDLMAIVERLDDFYIRELLKAILNDTEINRRLKLWQAGKTIHHAYKSGLLEHILSCATLAESLSAHYKCNKNYVVIGAIIHDICKVYELTDGNNVEYTEEGKLVGHLVKSLELMDRFSYRIKNFPYNMKLHLRHIMLSHHGEYDYGSPKIPQTSEAMLVHLIDNMDSKMNAFETIKKNDKQSGHWSSYVRHLDRIIFKDELPFYPDQLEDKASYKPKVPKPAAIKASEPKTAMSNLLKDFKID